MSSIAPDIEERLTKLEKEMEHIKARLPNEDAQPWWLKTAGMFKGDKAFAEIAQLGREFREADRRKARTASRKKRAQ
jgi:hypothetical protein